MKPVWIGVVFVVAALVSGLTVQAALTAEETSAPPHARPAAMGGSFVDPAMSGVLGTQEAVALVEWVKGVEDGIWFAAVEEQERAQARAADVRRVVSGTATGTCGLVGWSVPDSVLFRESRCSEDAFNATGCSGRGCIGAAQLDLGHGFAVSPWNPNVPGTCADLDLTVVADQQECASRLPRSAW